MAFEANRDLCGQAASAASNEAATHERMSEALEAALADWELPLGTSVARICESENATFLAVTPDARRIVLRVHRPGYNDAGEIRSEHAWIDALRRDRTIATPAVLRRRDGDTIGRIRIDGTDRRVAAFEFMAGREPAVDGDLPAWFGRLGALTARLHRQSRGWTRPAGFRRKVWTFETTLGNRPHWGDWRHALGLGDDGRRVIARAAERIEARLAAYGTDAARFGLIHADLRLANLLAEDERLGVIDFDDCGFGWFMYDFAAAVSFIEHEPIVEELRWAWVEGYRTVDALRAEDEAILGILVMLRRILLTAWVASRPASEAARALGTAFTAGTVELGERFLSRSGQP